LGEQLLEVTRAFSANEFFFNYTKPWGVVQASSQCCAFGTKQIYALSVSQAIEVLQSQTAATISLGCR
jgi:hypothetical protein